MVARQDGRTDSGGGTKSIRDFTLFKDKALMIYWPRCRLFQTRVPSAVVVRTSSYRSVSLGFLASLEKG
jgi:hypothetical protein